MGTAMGNRWKEGGEMRDWPNRVICPRQRRPFEFPLQITSRGRAEDREEGGCHASSGTVHRGRKEGLPIEKTYFRWPEMKMCPLYKKIWMD